MTDRSFHIAAIVLDFDGVILESVDIKTKVFRELFKAYPDDVERILAYHVTHNGISRIIKLRHIFENMLGISYTPELERQTTEKFSQLAFDQVLSCPFVAGAEDFLKRFSRLYPLYVASASPHEELVRVVEARQLSSFFIGVHGHPTHKREVLERVIGSFKALPQDILYVGDSQEDFKVAREKGVRFVGRRNKEPLSEKESPVFNDLVEIGAWMDANATKKSLA